MSGDALELAREVIAKYGADADKPSVHLANELIRVMPVYLAACALVDAARLNDLSDAGVLRMRDATRQMNAAIDTARAKEKP